MKLEACQYAEKSGWNKQPDSALDSPQTVLLFFASSDKSIIESQLQILRQSFPQSLMLGCSSAGEIFADDVYDNSISLSIIQFENTALQLATQQISAASDSFRAGVDIANSLSRDDLTFVLVLCDGLAVNGSRLIAGLAENLSDKVIITGGLAGDGDRFEQTWVWCDTGVQSKQICAIGFYGEHVGIGHGSRGGWDVLGPEREVTRATDNVLYELDGQPALQLYKKYLGDRADGLPATGLLFPLAISNDEENEDVVRTILAIDEEKESITFAGDIPQGSFVRLMRANFDRLIDGAADAVDAISMGSYKNGPLLNIAISCVGRRLVLGPRTAEEIEAVLNGLPENTKQIGFYSYGEISPLTNGKCDLHNQTMTLTLIWENS